MIEQKNGGQANEMELFHGTSNNDPQEIYDSEEGFDMRFSASGMWGQAVILLSMLATLIPMLTV